MRHSTMISPFNGSIEHIHLWDCVEIYLAETNVVKTGIIRSIRAVSAGSQGSETTRLRPPKQCWRQCEWHYIILNGQQRPSCRFGTCSATTSYSRWWISSITADGIDPLRHRQQLVATRHECHTWRHIYCFGVYESHVSHLQPPLLTFGHSGAVLVQFCHSK
jgi:hypothetical protein